MYRTKHFRWKLMHLWGILSHLGLVVAAAVGFLYHLGTTDQAASWGYQTAADVHSCGYPMIGRYGSGFTLDMAARTQLMTCFVVVSTPLSYAPCSMLGPCTPSVTDGNFAFALSREVLGLPSTLLCSRFSSWWSPTGSC